MGEHRESLGYEGEQRGGSGYSGKQRGEVWGEHPKVEVHVYVAACKSSHFSGLPYLQKNRARSPRSFFKNCTAAKTHCVCQCMGVRLGINDTSVILFKSSAFVCMLEIRTQFPGSLLSNVNQTLNWGASRLKILLKGALTGKMLRNTALEYNQIIGKPCLFPCTVRTDLVYVNNVLLLQLLSLNLS